MRSRRSFLTTQANHAYIISMIQPMLGQDGVLRRLAPLTNLVGVALLKGTRAALSFFGEGKPFDPVLFATLVRYHTRLHLQAQRIHVADEDVPAFNSQSLPNIGLQITYDGYVVKILKSVEHMLPVAASAPKSAFYHQQMTFVVDEQTGDARLSELNLVYLWDCDDKHVLTELQLACPSAGSETRASIKAHWYAPLEIPNAEKDVPKVVHEQAASASLDDLEIALPQDDQQINRNLLE